MNYLAAFFYDFCFKGFFELSENDTKKKTVADPVYVKLYTWGL